MRIQYHLKRLRHQFGEPLKLGQRSFKLRGYHADRLATDFSHEPQFLNVLERLFRERSGAFIDIGTNVGQTLIKVLAIDPDRHYSQASLERQTGHNDFRGRLPSLIVTDGLQRYPEKGEVINNKVFWLPLE